MTYRVIISARAEAQLSVASDWIAERSPTAALGWYNAFTRKLKTLRKNPFRCERVTLKRFPCEVRQFLFGRRRNYRAFFTVRDQMVIILAIRHAAQDEMSIEDV
jgi:plasmid stabilization system protein ParE